MTNTTFFFFFSIYLYFFSVNMIMMCNYINEYWDRTRQYFLCFSPDCAYYTSRCVQSLIYEPAIHCTKSCFSFCYLSNVSNVLFLFVVVNALFLPIGIDMMYKYLRLNIEFLFVCTKCFFHYARLVENHVSFFSLFVHWSVNCLFFFFSHCLTSLIFEYFFVFFLNCRACFWVFPLLSLLPNIH